MKSLREQIENLIAKCMFFTQKIERKNNLLKMIILFQGFPQEMTWLSLIYRQLQSNHSFKMVSFHEQNMPESPQEQSTDPSNRSTSIDHQRYLIPIPSIKHRTNFAISSIMVEGDKSITCQK